MYKTSIVTQEQAVTVWGDILPWVEDVCDFSDGRATPAETLDRVLKNHATLWIAYEDDPVKIVGFFITKISEYPKMRALTVEQLGGEDFSEWIHQAQHGLEIWARHNGCNRLELYGRPGWERRLQEVGWGKKKFITLEFNLEEDGQGRRELTA